MHVSIYGQVSCIQSTPVAIAGKRQNEMVVYLVVYYMKKQILVSVTPAYEYPPSLLLLPLHLSFVQIYICNVLLSGLEIK